LTEIDLLKRQVDILEKQLNQALLRENQSLERESFYQEQIEAMQRLLEAPKPNITTSIDPDIAPSIDPNMSREQSTTKSNENEAKSEQELQNPRIPTPEHIEPEPQKRGFLSRFFMPNGGRYCLIYALNRILYFAILYLSTESNCSLKPTCPDQENCTNQNNYHH
jgi:hypothetical protein